MKISDLQALLDEKKKSLGDIEIAIVRLDGYCPDLVKLSTDDITVCTPHLLSLYENEFPDRTVNVVAIGFGAR